MLAGGFGSRGAEIFASARTSDGAEAPYIAALRARAERAQPKPTDKNPMYAHFGARRCGPARSQIALSACSKSGAKSTGARLWSPSSKA